MDEFLLLEHIKEQLCFVSQDMKQDLDRSCGRQSAYRYDAMVRFICPPPVHAATADSHGYALQEGVCPA